MFGLKDRFRYIMHKISNLYLHNRVVCEIDREGKNPNIVYIMNDVETFAGFCIGDYAMNNSYIEYNLNNIQSDDADIFIAAHTLFELHELAHWAGEDGYDDHSIDWNPYLVDVINYTIDEPYVLDYEHKP